MPASPDTRQGPIGQALVPEVHDVGELLPGGGRSVARTVKLTRREDAALTVVADVRQVGASTLLHRYPIAEILRQYEQIIARARESLAAA